MSAFERNQITTQDDLNWYITVVDTLTDQQEVSFQIWDISSGSPGTQIFPEVEDEWEEVTTSGKFDTGSYYAYDNSVARGWQVPSDANLGEHRIKWRWRLTASSPYRYDQEDFTVVPSVSGTDTYITLTDIRNEGITEAIASDSAVTAAILLWQEVLDRCCRQWFLPRELTIEFDGDNSTTINLGIPCIEVEYLRINNSSDDLDSSLYKVYGNQTEGLQSRRRNPKIALVQYITSDINRDIHLGPFFDNRLAFLKGYKNQVISGAFGFVNADLSPPLAIKRALTKLVVEKIMNPIYPGNDASTPSAPSFAGIVVEEKTDGHSLKYGSIDYSKRKSGLIGITSDPEIQDIIKLYRGPIGIATPSHWMY